MPRKLLAAFLVVLFSQTAIQAQTSWIDFNNGSWDDPNNWNNGVPTTNSIVSINIGQITHSTTGGSTIRDLNYGFGTSDLNLGTDLTVTGHMFWEDGDILGPAALNLTGTALVEDGHLKGTVNSTAVVNVKPFVFFNGAGSDGIWNNQSGAQFILEDNADLAFSSTFNNNSGAIIRKLTSPDESRFNWNLNSTGLIEVQNGGHLTLLGESFIDGDVTIGNGGVLEFGTIEDYTFGANATVTGDGYLELGAGDAIVDSVLNVDSNFRMDGTSTLTGSGTLNVNGFFDWQFAGDMEGTGTTNLNGNTLITGGGLDRTLNNYGSVQFNPNTFLSGSGSSTRWNNKSGAVFDILDDKGLAFDGTFVNENGAIFRKSGGTSTFSNISWDFFNNGIVEGNSGEIWFTGDFTQGATGELRLNGGTFKFTNFTGSSGGSYSGSGTIESSTATVSGRLAPGNSPGIMSFTGDLIIQNSAVMEFELGTLQDLVIVDDDLTVDGLLRVFALSGFGVGDYTLFEYGGNFIDNGVVLDAAPGGYNYALLNDSANSRFYLSITAVPEPTSAAVVSLLLLSGLVRRRRQSY